MKKKFFSCLLTVLVNFYPHFGYSANCLLKFAQSGDSIYINSGLIKTMKENTLVRNCLNNSKKSSSTFVTIKVNRSEYYLMTNFILNKNIGPQTFRDLTTITHILDFAETTFGLNEENLEKLREAKRYFISGREVTLKFKPNKTDDPKKSKSRYKCAICGRSKVRGCKDLLSDPGESNLVSMEQFMKDVMAPHLKEYHKDFISAVDSDAKVNPKSPHKAKLRVIVHPQVDISTKFYPKRIAKISDPLKKKQ